LTRGKAQAGRFEGNFEVRTKDQTQPTDPTAAAGA
jgi:hypothetical protein